MSASVTAHRRLVPSPQVVQPIERVLASRSDIKVGLIDKREMGYRHVADWCVSRCRWFGLQIYFGQAHCWRATCADALLPIFVDVDHNATHSIVVLVVFTI